MRWLVCVCERDSRTVVEPTEFSLFGRFFFFFFLCFLFCFVFEIGASSFFCPFCVCLVSIFPPSFLFFLLFFFFFFFFFFLSICICIWLIVVFCVCSIKTTGPETRIIATRSCRSTVCRTLNRPQSKSFFRKQPRMCPTFCATATREKELQCVQVDTHTLCQAPATTSSLMLGASRVWLLTRIASLQSLEQVALFCFVSSY